MIYCGKKASAKAVKLASKLSGKELSKLTSWKEAFEILYDGFYCEIHTGTETVVKIYKETKDKPELIETKKFPKEETFEAGDWNWNYLYKELTVWMTENRKKFVKVKRAKTK